METPTPNNAARREGDRRVGDDRLDAGRPQRRARRARAVRRPPRRPALQRRERLARAPGGEGVTKIALTRQRRDARGGRRAPAAARVLPARAARAQGDERRLRHVLVRGVHGAARRRVGEVVHVLAVQADGAEVTTIEGLASGRRAAPDAAGVPREPRAPVRLLHAGVRHGRGLAAEGATRTRRRTRSASALEGNLCRCTGYHNIVRAVEAAARAGA